jgi:thioredoxin 1
MTIRHLLLCVALLATTVTNAVAAERFAYAPAQFQTALETGKPILVHITAPWCGECKQQKPIVAALVAEPAYKDLIIFDVDFDTQRDALRQLKVQKQSTLVVFKDKNEVARAVGITQRDAIEAVLKKAL